MSEIIEGMRVINKIQDGVVKTNKSLLPFQNGILLSNLSLQNMLPYLKCKYPNVEYIITSRLNQDVLETSFLMSDAWVVGLTILHYWNSNTD